MNRVKREKYILRAREIFAQAGITAKTGFWTYEELRSDKLKNYPGFANYYLKQCIDLINGTDKANISIYKELYYVDKAFGTTACEQLQDAVTKTLREDIIKVDI